MEFPGFMIILVNMFEYQGSVRKKNGNLLI